MTTGWRYFMRAIAAAALFLGGTALGQVCTPSWTREFQHGEITIPVTTLVEAFAEYDDGHGPALYAAGDFLGASGFPADRIAMWDGTWIDLKGGTDGLVRDLTVFDAGSGQVLIAGGDFLHAGG